MNRKILFLILVFLSLATYSLPAQQVWGNWQKWGAQNDGVYYNPIILSIK
jgi:hypothetical protein